MLKWLQSLFICNHRFVSTGIEQIAQDEYVEVLTCQKCGEQEFGEIIEF